MSAKHPGYCIDTSCLINMADIYPYDLFPGLWDNLESLIHSGNVLVHRLVREELCAKYSKEDFATEWIGRFPLSQFIDIDAEQTGFITYMGDKDKYLRHLFAQPEYATKADPFVIACAHVHGFAVVTDEGKSKWKMPYVCRLFDIPPLRLLEFFRDAGWTFR